jgi:hypothetical protein
MGVGRRGGLVALKMALGREDWRLGDHLPPWPFPEIAASTVALVSTLMSIGGATFVVPLLTLYGRPILSAVATATGFGTMVAIPGVIGYAWAGWGAAGLPPFSLGYVNLLGLAIVAPMSVYAAPYGVRVAHNIPRRKLELAFAAFLATVSIRFLIDLYPEPGDPRRSRDDLLIARADLRVLRGSLSMSAKMAFMLASDAGFRQPRRARAWRRARPFRPPARCGRR